jgi:type V secretory pathway adhesin AidA
MKKILFAAVAVMALGVSNAQIRERGDIELAPHIGYSSFLLNGDQVEDLSAVTAVNYGVNADYFFNDRWSLRSGLLFQEMGGKDSFDELKLSYITIPLNANWHFGSTRKWFLNFGTSASFLTKAEFSGEDIKENIESLQLGIFYGIGYKLEITDKFSILIESQNLFGLSNIFKEGDITWTNSGGSINVGGVFKL